MKSAAPIAGVVVGGVGVVIGVAAAENACCWLCRCSSRCAVVFLAFLVVLRHTEVFTASVVPVPVAACALLFSEPMLDAFWAFLAAFARSPANCCFTLARSTSGEGGGGGAGDPLAW